MVACSVLGCKNRSKSSAGNVTFHRFPKDGPELQNWILACGRDNWTPKQSASICSAHFEDHCFVKTTNKTWLKPNSLLTISIHQKPDIKADENADSDDTISIDSHLMNETSTSITTNTEKESDRLHVGLTCNSCFGEIRGFRYVCVQCSDWDMCGGCEARGEHPQHYVLRIPSPQTQQKIASVMEVLQKQLKTLLEDIENLQNKESEDEIKVEFESFEAQPDPLFEDDHEESVVPQFTPSAVKPVREPIERTKEKPPTKWPVLTLAVQGIWDQENATEKSKLQIYVENQSNQLSNTVMKVVPPDDNEAGKQTQLDESQPGTSANKRKTREQACTSTKIPKIQLKRIIKKP